MRAVLAALALTLAGCFTPNLGEGKVLCGANQACPTGYVCAGDGRCYTSEPDLGAASSDLAGCVRTTCGTNACGVIDDNCGGTVDCGDSNCTTGTTCGGGGTPHVCGCPTQVSCGNHNCGTMPDGCGGSETCGGACPLPQTCGGGNGGMKMANVCGIGMPCMPVKCGGSDCGLISDGCSAVIDCGSCQTGKSCGTDHMCH